MEKDIAIKVEDLTKIYPIYNNKNDRMKEALSLTRKKYHTEFHALNNISFEVKRGETVGIIGQNGSGKSTLLKILTGVLSPTSGSVLVNGKVSALLELGAGFNPEMTGMENIYLNGTIMGYAKEEMDERIPQIIDFADIGEFITQPVKMYSSGMFVRLAFAVAINVEPDILIVDEALSVGDMAFQAKCMAKMKEIITKGVTVFFVSHDMDTIKSLCQRCYYLEGGNLMKEGQASDVADLYLNSIRASMNAANIKIINNGELNEKINSYNRNIVPSNVMCFKEDESFQKRVQTFRQGNEEVKIQFAEIVGEDDEVNLRFSFNELVKIRIYIEFFADKKVSIGYHIRNDKNIETIGTNSRIEGMGTIFRKAGEKIVAEFITRLPLLEGKYNVSLVISEPIGRYSSYFVDYMENAILFSVDENHPYKLWNSVYVENKLNLYDIPKKKCSICGNEMEAFMPLDSYYETNQRKYGYDVDRLKMEMLNRNEYGCPFCGASDRDRLYSLFIKRKLYGINKNDLTLVDIAPSQSLATFINNNYNINYISIDKYMENVTYNIDLMDMRFFKENSVDAFICSHVLEHVDNDIKAMKELFRILKEETGWGILVVPIDLNCGKTIENLDTTPEERWKYFGQNDHVRKYNKEDYLCKLRSVGFCVEELGVDYFGTEAFNENAIEDQAVLYIVSKKTEHIVQSRGDL